MAKESILVVEDEDIMRESLVDWFSSEGYNIDSIGDGDKGLTKFNLKNYNMFKKTGKETGRHLSKTRYLYHQHLHRHPKGIHAIKTGYSAGYSFKSRGSRCCHRLSCPNSSKRNSKN